jgi:hypothetical protein
MIWAVKDTEYGVVYAEYIEQEGNDNVWFRLILVVTPKGML